MSKFQLNFKGSKEELHNWLKKLKKEEGTNINPYIINLIQKDYNKKK